VTDDKVSCIHVAQVRSVERARCGISVCEGFFEIGETPSSLRALHDGLWPIGSRKVLLRPQALLH